MNLPSCLAWIRKLIIDFLTKIKYKTPNNPELSSEFSCLAMGDDKLIQCYNHELRYHNHIRYAYFYFDKIIRACYHRKKSLIFRITCLKKNIQVANFTVDFSLEEEKTNIINGISTREILINNSDGHIIVRIPIGIDTGQASVVFIYHR